MLRRFFVKDVNRPMTYEEIAEYSGETKNAVQKRIARRGYPKEFFIKDISGIGEEVIRKDSVHVIDVQLPNNKSRMMTLGMIVKELKRITNTDYDPSNVKRKWLRRGAPKQLHINELIEDKSKSKRYAHSRKDRRGEGKRFPPLTWQDALGIKQLAAEVIQDAVLVYLIGVPKRLEGRARRKAMRDMADATTFLFAPNHSMRKFWIGCLEVDNFNLDKKYLDANRQTIIDRIRKFDEKRNV